MHNFLAFFFFFSVIFFHARVFSLCVTRSCRACGWKTTELKRLADLIKSRGSLSLDFKLIFYSNIAAALFALFASFFGVLEVSLVQSPESLFIHFKASRVAIRRVVCHGPAS